MNGIETRLWVGIVLGLVISSPAESQQPALPPMDGRIAGTVIETMDAANYTYVHVDAGTRSIWAAAPQFAVKVGDQVSVPTASPMQNYHSKTLGRTFSLVYFAGRIRVGAPGTTPAIPTDRAAPDLHSSSTTSVPEQSLAGISKPEGGHTVGEVFDQGKGLAGSEVAIRGRVVKYSARIMGTNWLHLQDGTRGKDGNDDLVITTDDVAAVGDLVVIRGVVSADKDFGYGYKYELIVEHANVTVE